MSEMLNELPIQEILRPDVTPEMGFQSYEMFADNTEDRNAQQALFLNGEVVYPTLRYPLINDVELSAGIKRLDTVGARALEITDEDVSDAVWNSAGYRLAEMYWLKETGRLNVLSDQPESEAFRQSALRYQEMNEQLYGAPDFITTGMVIGEIIAQAEAKQLDERALKILDELKHGTTVSIGGEDIVINGIESLENGRLPEIAGRLDVLQEIVEEEFSSIYNLVNTYWDSVVMPRAIKAGHEPKIEQPDMVELFTKARDLMDPENQASISIVETEKAATISWSTPQMSVLIGRKRAAITNPLEMIGSIVHELGGHGGRAIHGLKTELPVLGTGLYTEAEEGEQADYLSFEEGLLTLAEMAIMGNIEKWKAVHVSHYLNIALAYEGADAREAFETVWRARALMTVLDGKPLTDEIIAAQRKQAYVSLIRTRRGTPMHVEVDQQLTYNKDLAYLQGKLVALRFLDKVGNDKAAIRQAFRGKFDPMNDVQKRLADKYIPAV